MELAPRTTGQPRGEFTDSATRALRSLTAGDEEPLLLGYHPVARMNPYQDLLYQRAWEAGVAALPIVRAERIPELKDLVERGIRGVLHLHWLSPVLADAANAGQARRFADEFTRDLDAFRAIGGRIVWTVHNILPHGSRFDEEESRVRAAVVERSDAVHVLIPRTPELVRPWFEIPDEKVLVVEHPSYLGAYEDWMTRDQARHLLGIAPDELVYVVIGAIRPYKGINELLDAWDEMDDVGPRRLVIAGGPTAEPGVAAAMERAAIHPSVLLHGRPVPSDEIQAFLRAADVAVLPYLRSLNSGSQMLALTFGVPVVVPAGAGMEDIADPSFGRTFQPDVPGDLARVLAAAAALATPDASAAARAEAERRAPGPLSLRFARELRARIGVGSLVGSATSA